ncbi:MAG: aldehyde dehydrogenase family protein [Deltaproteobacteria bacterium]|nr:aldehyde dehydrogenase family protein [Deltaproteobacteria bacterium]
MKEILRSLGLSDTNPGAFGIEAASSGPLLKSFSPIDNSVIASVTTATAADYERVLRDTQNAFTAWRKVPAPERGQVVREIAVALREHKAALGKLVSIETGKILSEGEGEIQEAIDIADFAVGLSRQLYGLSMHSERPLHHMMEQWHPLGVVGVITAFNFPAAVWAWNSMLAAVCGDTVLWKPSEYAPITAIAMNSICARIAEQRGHAGIFGLVVGDGPELGKQIAADARIPLVSATGSTRMGRAVAETVGRRLGKTILELGGNNAVIVLQDADLDLVVRSTAFGAVGTAGQRCTTTRRVLIEKPLEAEFLQRMLKAYRSVKIGNPLESGVLMGPLINKTAVENYKKAIELAKQQGGEILCGGEVCSGMQSDLYVTPTIIKAHAKMEIVREETFAPILYVIGVKDYDEAIELHNSVPQGLSSAIFTRGMQAAQRFMSAQGSDCGIANVNLGTSGAEIGGAFGGEKDTGGGRESGSDAWKAYMRRQTNTINYGNALPLAQGVKFDV